MLTFTIAYRGSRISSGSYTLEALISLTQGGICVSGVKQTTNTFARESDKSICGQENSRIPLNLSNYTGYAFDVKDGSFLVSSLTHEEGDRCPGPFQGVVLSFSKDAMPENTAENRKAIIRFLSSLSHKIHEQVVDRRGEIHAADPADASITLTRSLFAFLIQENASLIEKFKLSPRPIPQFKAGAQYYQTCYVADNAVGSNHQAADIILGKVLSGQILESVAVLTQLQLTHAEMQGRKSIELNELMRSEVPDLMSSQSSSAFVPGPPLQVTSDTSYKADYSKAALLLCGTTDASISALISLASADNPDGKLARRVLEKLQKKIAVGLLPNGGML